MKELYKTDVTPGEILLVPDNWNEEYLRRNFKFDPEADLPVLPIENASPKPAESPGFTITESFEVLSNKVIRTWSQTVVPLYTPDCVTQLQMRLHLMETNDYDGVKQSINEIPDLNQRKRFQTKFQYCEHFRRNDEIVDFIADERGWSSSQTDQFFRDASAIEV